MPEIDWIGWNIAGRSLDMFPPRAAHGGGVTAREARQKGRRLPDGGFVPFNVLGSFKSEYDLDVARNLIIRHLQPSSCPFFPCETSPAREERYRETADRLGFPYDDPYDEQGRLDAQPPASPDTALH